MKALLLLSIISTNCLSLESTTPTPHDSVSVNVSSSQYRETNRHSNGDLITREDLLSLRGQITRMQTEHQDKERKSKCKVVTAFVGSVATLLGGIASVIYAIKECEPRN